MAVRRERSDVRGNEFMSARYAFAYALSRVVIRMQGKRLNTRRDEVNISGLKAFLSETKRQLQGMSATQTSILGGVLP